MKKLDTNLSSPYDIITDDDDYIDMEVGSSCSSSNILCYSSINSPPQSREFEFQMSSSISNDGEATTSPADELFYKGKLLPLHLPPRLQMVQRLLGSSAAAAAAPIFDGELKEEEEDAAIFCDQEDQYRRIPPFVAVESRNTISPSESSRASSELNPDDCYFEWSTELSNFIVDRQHHHHHHLPKKSWSKKLKLIKQSSTLCQKLKASRAYLKSLFSVKPGCSEIESERHDDESKSKKHSPNKLPKNGKKSPFGLVGKGLYPTTLADAIKGGGGVVGGDGDGDGGDFTIEDTINDKRQHRQSFSGAAIKRHSSKCSSSSSTSSSSSAASSSSSSSSSSFSFNSNGFYDLQFLKRSSSATSEIEGSIEAAIAHCKKSQQLFHSTQALLLGEAGLCSMSAPRVIVVNGDQDLPSGVCSI